MRYEPDDEHGMPRLREYFGVLLARRWLVLSVFVLTVGIVALLTFTRAPLYRATSRLLIESKKPQAVGIPEVYESSDANRDYYETQYRLLRDRQLAEGGEINALPAVIGSETIQQLTLELAAAEQEQVQIRQKYLPKHPRATAVAGRIDVIQKRLEIERKRILVGRRTEFVRAKSEEVHLRAALARQKQEAQRLSRLAMQYRVLKDESDRVGRLYDVAHSTNVPNMDVVPCDRRPPNPAELLGSPRMKRFVREAAKKYDRIVFDSPPAARVADAHVLSSHADGVVMVVRSFNTDKHLAQRTKEAIEAVDGKIIGVVVNGVDAAKRAGYYGYGYHRYGRYHGYGYGRQDEDLHTETLADATVHEAAMADVEAGDDAPADARAAHRDSRDLLMLTKGERL